MAWFKKKSQDEKKAEEKKLQAKSIKGPGCFYWVLIIFILILIAGILGFSLKKVEADEVGLRVIKLGLGIWKTGPEYAKPLPPGWHPILPGFHEFVVYKKNLQTFEMTSKTGGIRKPDYPSLEVRTSDGYKVKVDITILYHILEGRANLVRIYYRDDQEIKAKGIQAVAPGVLQNKFSELKHAEDFYNSPLRTQKSEEARKILNDYFFKQGIEILDVIIRDFEFPEEYEEAILRKVLAEQLKRVQEAVAKAAQAEAEWKKTIAEADRDAQIERAQGEADAKKLEAEGERIKAELIAEGNKKLLEAQAKGKAELVRALAGRGGKIYVGLEYAKVLEGTELLILQSGKGGVNPLDVERMLDLFEKK